MRRETLFFVLGAIFITCLVTSDIIGGAKLVTLGHLLGEPILISVGMIAFPATFVITDLLNEFYGAKAARFVTYVGLGMLLVTFGILQVARVLPASPDTPYPAEWFQRIFGSSARMIVASLTAYFASQLIDVSIFTLFKRLTSGKHIWLRATGSTVISQLSDTVLVQFTNFAGKLPTETITRLAVSSYALKFAIAIGLTPVIYLGHRVIEEMLVADDAVPS